MREMEKEIRQVCKCENCGNEAEMVVTCSLQDTETVNVEPAQAQNTDKKRVKGTGTCSSCGNEADMWVDL